MIAYWLMNKTKITGSQLYDESYANIYPKSNKLILPHFILWLYLPNSDAVRGKLIRILS